MTNAPKSALHLRAITLIQTNTGMRLIVQIAACRLNPVSMDAMRPQPHSALARIVRAADGKLKIVMDAKI